MGNPYEAQNRESLYADEVAVLTPPPDPVAVTQSVRIDERIPESPLRRWHFRLMGLRAQKKSDADGRPSKLTEAEKRQSALVFTFCRYCDGRGGGNARLERPNRLRAPARGEI